MATSLVAAGHDRARVPRLGWLAANAAKPVLRTPVDQGTRVGQQSGFVRWQTATYTPQVGKLGGFFERGAMACGVRFEGLLVQIGGEGGAATELA